MSTSGRMQASHTLQPDPAGKSSTLIPRTLSSPSVKNSEQVGRWSTTRVLKREAQDQWPFTLKTHMPELDDMVKLRAMMRGELDISLLRESGKLLFGDEAGLFDENPRPLNGATGSRLFDDETRILILRSLPNDKIETSFRGRNGLQEVLASDTYAPKFQLFYITMFDKEIPGGGGRWEKRLRISADMFKKLALCHELPVAFIESLLNHRKELRHYSFGSRLLPIGQAKSLINDFWYSLPVRIPMRCSDPERAHRDFHSGNYQMNAFNHLHLGESKVDLRRFEIAVFFRYDISSKQTTVVCVNTDSRTEGPSKVLHTRVLNALEDGGTEMIDRNPLWVNLVYVGQVVRWWQTTLEYFSDELIRHEKKIEDKMTAQSDTKYSPKSTTNSVETNHALHAMAAHCLRYKTELDEISNAVSALINQHEELSAQLKLEPDEKERVSRALKQQLADVTASIRTQEELAKKTKNTLALLFHSVQADYDRQQVSNGQALREISEASQNEVIETRKDSLAMKTIAVMTMFFLPGTSIAAILALPYFQTAGPKRTIWIWAVLAATLTGIIFGLYRLLLRMKAPSEKERGEPDLEK